MKEILSFIKELTCAEKVTENIDIESDLGCYGDDFHELIEEYAKRFNVDISTYLWYFHTREEGSESIAELFFSPPNIRVKRIPITPKMLYEFAEKGKWEVKYPKHDIPKKRYDLFVNLILLIAIIILSIYYGLIK